MIGDFFTSLFAKLGAIVDWFAALFVSMFSGVWDLIRDAFAWVFDQVLSVAVAAVGSISLTGVQGSITQYGSIPANVMLVMSCIGLGQALTIITAALVIRFGLQLIPFVRLGS